MEPLRSKKKAHHETNCDNLFALFEIGVINYSFLSFFPISELFQLAISLVTKQAVSLSVPWFNSRRHAAKILSRLPVLIDLYSKFWKRSYFSLLVQRMAWQRVPIKSNPQPQLIYSSPEAKLLTLHTMLVRSSILWPVTAGLAASKSTSIPSLYHSLKAYLRS